MTQSVPGGDPGSEQWRVLFGFNQTRVPYPQDVCIHDLFEQQVRRQPEAVAAVYGLEQLTYAELADRSRALAACLQARGAGPDRVVGLCVDRSLDLLVGIMGILLSGAAYLPLDPELPAERLGYMLADSAAIVVVTQDEWCPKLAGLAGREKLVLLAATNSGSSTASSSALRPQVAAHHLAYVVYTSGSTGAPKGVAIEHRNIVHIIHWMRDFFRPAEFSGVLASASIGFDMSAFEILPTLCNGGTVIMAANALELLTLPARQQVTLVTTVPSVMAELLRHGAVPDSVQTVNLGGEALSTTLVNRLYDQTRVQRVYDLYGPTEITCCCTQVLREHGGRPTIGRPISNTQTYILDETGMPQPCGVEGELYIAGDGVARGYLNHPELTRERFRDNPFVPGGRIYRSGDLARWLDDGQIEYLGRIDTQVKIRGVRIELGEIESRLRAHAAVDDCVVVAQGEDSNKRLVAFYRASAAACAECLTDSADSLKSHAAQALPASMVPAAFVRVSAIPLTANGKADRQALKQLTVDIPVSGDHQAVRNDTEVQLLQLWAQVLDRQAEQIGVNDNFFDIGGHSMAAIALVVKINQQFNCKLPLGSFTGAPTVASVAHLLAHSLSLPSSTSQPTTA